MSEFYSLKKNKDFQAVYKNGRSYANQYLVMYIKKRNDDGENRVGISVSKKVGNSVKRNRARRLMRESYRHIQDKLPCGYDFIIIARNTINDKKCSEVEKSLISAFRRTGVLKK